MSNNMPLVSIVVPIYNVEKYLRQCLDSISIQSYSNLEIILVNDGSTDSSLDIANEYACKDSRVKIINQKNKGAGYSRNVGLKCSSGTYIMFFDSDDYMEEYAINLMIKKATEMEAEIVIAKSNDYYNDTKETKKLKSIDDNFITKPVFSAEDNCKYIFNFCTAWAWDKLYKKSFLTQNNIFFQNLSVSNDMFFTLYSLSLAKNICIIDDYMFYHRRNVYSSLSNSRDKTPLECFKAIYKLRDVLMEKKEYDKFEQSFINYIIKYLIWHSNSLKNESKILVLLYTKIYIFKMFHILEKNENYFYDRSYYTWIHFVNNWTVSDKVNNICENYEDLLIYAVGHEFIGIKKNKSIKSLFRFIYLYLFCKITNINNFFQNIQAAFSKNHLSYEFGKNILQNNFLSLITLYKNREKKK
ncbi:glycosyltransferase family 2 protein [Campylobacter lari]|uniref:glycosyltransferase family 2 protein n=1 Tax=Campylobacter lari TaxID=201 RepID=UPI000581EDCB|nr:glycosyltransferase [Campylobacter lari]AJD04379.1 glycosyltransferase, family 2 [Campylobacter lari RM16701]EAK3364913.1 glycosyl transferase family 2 [Campylobacter lari]